MGRLCLNCGKQLAPEGYMASPDIARYNEPETLDSLIADRERGWHGFMRATTGTIVFLGLLLIGMAVFLL